MVYELDTNIFIQSILIYNIYIHHLYCYFHMEVLCVIHNYV
jgi:hypothetical protein